MKNQVLLIFFVFTVSIAFSQSFNLSEPDPTNSSLNGNTITDLLIDTNDVVCYTRGDSALAIYDGNNWTYKGYTAYGFSGNNSPSMEIDMAPNGDYWLAYFSGLDIFDGSAVTNMTAANSDLENDFFTDLAIDNNGLTFIGYGNGFGISMIDNGTWTHKGDFTGNLTPFNSVFTASFIEVNKQTNDTWILSGDNFFKLNNGDLTTYTGTSTNIPYNAASDVTGMTVTADGKVWFSLESVSNDPAEGGLLSFDGTNWMHYNTDNSDIASNNITAIASYQNQLVFNHYSIDGISVFDGVSWTLYDGTNGTNYPTNANYFVHDMKALDNVVYMATNSGLFIMELPEIVGLNEESSKGVSIYPNPTTQFIHVYSDLSDLSFEFRNAIGEVVNSGELVSNKVDISDLSNGIYFVSLFSNGNVISTEKIIKK